MQNQRTQSQRTSYNKNNIYKYICEFCQYATNKKSNYMRHKERNLNKCNNCNSCKLKCNCKVIWF